MGSLRSSNLYISRPYLLVTLILGPVPLTEIRSSLRHTFGLTLSMLWDMMSRMVGAVQNSRIDTQYVEHPLETHNAVANLV